MDLKKNHTALASRTNNKELVVISALPELGGNDLCEKFCHAPSQRAPERPIAVRHVASILTSTAIIQRIT